MWLITLDRILTFSIFLFELVVVYIFFFIDIQYHVSVLLSDINWSYISSLDFGTLFVYFLPIMLMLNAQNVLLLCSYGLAKMLESSINAYTIIETKIFSNYASTGVGYFCLSHPYWNMKQTKWRLHKLNPWPVWMWTLTRPRLSLVLARNLWNICLAVSRWNSSF